MILPAQESNWAPSPRPEWVAQLNKIGENAGRPNALVDLSEDSLIDAAANVTGLSDFGPDTWQQGFSRLVPALNRDARLNLIGRVVVRAEILRSLRTRLEMAETVKRQPEILHEKITKPIFITGMGRSGTSVLHELLAEDPQFRVPLTWELLHPCPPPVAGEAADEPRVAEVDAEHRFWGAITPEYRTMHDNRGDGPNECVLGMMHEFASPTWSAAHFVPDYEMWFALDPLAARLAFSFHRRLLQLLQFKAPGRWLLKAPSHIASLSALFAEYPDAHVITTHRDPLKTLPSLASLIATMRRQRSDHVDYDAIVQLVAAGLPTAMNTMLEFRDGGTVPSSQFSDVHYGEFMRDPMTSIRNVYDELSLEFSPEVAQRMQTYLRQKPKDRFGAHNYKFSDMNLNYETTRAAFRRYQTRFNVGDET